MQISHYTIIAVLAVSVLTPAFASHGLATIDIPEGSGVPGCEVYNTCFFPYDVTIDVGGSVTWTNSDENLHTIASGDLDVDPNMVRTDYPNGFDSGLVMVGEQFSHTFEEAGTYPYFCYVHPWMRGIVNVENAHQNPNIPTNSTSPITEPQTKPVPIPTNSTSPVIDEMDDMMTTDPIQNSTSFNEEMEEWSIVVQLRAMIAELEAKINELKEDKQNKNARIDTLKDKLETKTKEIDNQKAKFETKLDKKDAKIDKLENKIVKLEDIIDRKDSKIDRKDTNIDNKKEKLDAMKAQMGEMIQPQLTIKPVPDPMTQPENIEPFGFSYESIPYISTLQWTHYSAAMAEKLTPQEQLEFEKLERGKGIPRSLAEKLDPHYYPFQCEGYSSQFYSKNGTTLSIRYLNSLEDSDNDGKCDYASMDLEIRNGTIPYSGHLQYREYATYKGQVHVWSYEYNNECRGLDKRTYLVYQNGTAVKGSVTEFSECHEGRTHTINATLHQLSDDGIWYTAKFWEYTYEDNYKYQIATEYRYHKDGTLTYTKTHDPICVIAPCS